MAGSVLGLGALLAPAATASVGNQENAVRTLGPSSMRPTAEKQHCAVSLVPESSTDASGVQQHCFERFADAVAYGTDGEVRLAPDARPEALDLDSKAVASSALLGVLYDAKGYDGASQVLNGTGSGCYAGKTYAVNNLDSVGFEDQANSFKVRSNCLGRVYADKDQEGATYLCEDDCSSLGNMNNRASSVKFF